MGASVWDYRTPYTLDLAEALGTLRQQVFAANEYFWSGHDEPWSEHDGDDEDERPGSIDELWEDEGVQEEGTHSILDINTVIGENDQDNYGTLRLLTPAETAAVFGTPQPTAADLAGLESPYDDRPRWSGHAAILYADGKPAEYLIWGHSGDCLRSPRRGLTGGLGLPGRRR